MKSHDLYLFLDEVVRLGKVGPIEDLISVGRSKCVRPLVSFQDIGQLIDLYGENLAKTRASQFGQLQRWANDGLAQPPTP